MAEVRLYSSVYAIVGSYGILAVQLLNLHRCVMTVTNHVCFQLTLGKNLKYRKVLHYLCR